MALNVPHEQKILANNEIKSKPLAHYLSNPQWFCHTVDNEAMLAMYLLLKASL